jgi:hypothetical protein
MKKILAKVAMYTFLVSTIAHVPLYASECSNTFSTTVDEVRTAFRNGTPLIDNSCNPARQYKVTELLDTLQSVQGSDHITFSPSTYPPMPNSPLAAVIENPPKLDANGMPLPGTGGSGIFRADIKREDTSTK